MIETFVKSAQGQFVEAVGELGIEDSIQLLAKLLIRMKSGDELFGELVTIDRIQRAVAKFYDMRLIDMTSSRRSKDIARPRQTAMYLARCHTKRSLPEIGRRFGNRDHTTVIHAVRAVTARRLEDADLDADIRAIEAAL